MTDFLNNQSKRSISIRISLLLIVIFSSTFGSLNANDEVKTSLISKIEPKSNKYSGHSGKESDTESIKNVLNLYHIAASKADFDGYFSLMAPDAIFLGTDGTEHWNVEEFKAFVEPYFSKGVGWTYVAQQRHVYFSSTGDVAWFDEELMNASYGHCRGTGVLEKIDGQWKIRQYNLTIPIPNELSKRVVKLIREKD